MDTITKLIVITYKNGAEIINKLSEEELQNLFGD